MKIQILKQCNVGEGKGPGKPGDVVEVSDRRGRLLIGANLATANVDKPKPAPKKKAASKKAKSGDESSL